MCQNKKSLRTILAFVKQMSSMELTEPGDRREIDNGVALIQHGLAVKSTREVERGIVILAKVVKRLA